MLFSWEGNWVISNERFGMNYKKKENQVAVWRMISQSHDWINDLCVISRALCFQFQQMYFKISSMCQHCTTCLYVQFLSCWLRFFLIDYDIQAVFSIKKRGGFSHYLWLKFIAWNKKNTFYEWQMLWTQLTE